LIAIGTPGRLGTTKTAPLSARTGDAAANVAMPIAMSAALRA
jgi:hypothetical protein